MPGRTFADFYTITSTVTPTTIADNGSAEHVVTISTWTAPRSAASRLITVQLEWAGPSLTCDHAHQTGNAWTYEHPGDNVWEHASWGPNSGASYFQYTTTLHRDAAAPSGTAVRVRSVATHIGAPPGEDFDDLLLT